MPSMCTLFKWKKQKIPEPEQDQVQIPVQVGKKATQQ